jgi:predicted glycosyltransferase
MVRYCGYARRNTPVQNEVDVLRHRLLAGYGKLVLVTPGGGEDGWNLVSSYTDAAPRIGGVRSVIVCGPEMPAHLREQICIRTADDPSISVTEFSGEMLHYMAAADVIVSMAGYNTICEIVSLGKRAVVVPRVHPVQEQFIRAERLAALGTLRMIHPDALTAAALAEMVQRELRETAPVRFPASLDGLEAIADWVQLSAPQPAILGKETLWRASATF